MKSTNKGSALRLHEKSHQQDSLLTDYECVQKNKERGTYNINNFIKKKKKMEAQGDCRDM